MFKNYIIRWSQLITRQGLLKELTELTQKNFANLGVVKYIYAECTITWMQKSLKLKHFYIYVWNTKYSVVARLDIQQVSEITENYY